MKISVITITYNAADVLPPTLKSVREQDCTDFEHIIIDGASSDDTILLARREGKEGIRIFSEPDKGLYDAMDKGLRAARGEFVLTAAAADTRRGLRVRAELDSPMTLPDIARLYEELYDDHNFTFLSPHAAPYAEVTGTDKIIISLSLAQGKLTIDAVADGHLRGGAGEAVHVMNLLFGLAERTGLALKASEYDAC